MLVVCGEAALLKGVWRRYRDYHWAEGGIKDVVYIDNNIGRIIVILITKAVILRYLPSFLVNSLTFVYSIGDNVYGVKEFIYWRGPIYAE